MIAGIFHQGSGIGNQLHRYVMTRVLAADKGYEWGMKYPLNFKGLSFMDLDTGKSFGDGRWAKALFQEKEVRDANGVDIRGYDPEINFVEDNTIIDGEFQDPRYFEHRMDDIAKWLAPITHTAKLSEGDAHFAITRDIPDNLCVIGFRGGEYTIFPDLFLQKEWWDKAIQQMRIFNPMMIFEVHTDDPTTASQFFPDYKIIQHAGNNWWSMRRAKYAIIANSSFYILPRLLAHHEMEGALTIAPRYWARHNTGVWALPQNYYSCFQYVVV